MQYSEVYKQRAVQLYAESTAKGVFQQLIKDFPKKPHPNERTLRRWSKQREAGKDKYGLEYLESQSLKEHFTQLTNIANTILEDDVGRVLTIADEADTSERIYQIVSEDSGFTELTHDQLVGRIEGNIDYVCQHYSPWHMWDCFAAHLEAEYPESKDFHRFLYTQTSTLINALRTIAERKTFKGTCPVCEDLQ